MNNTSAACPLCGDSGGKNLPSGLQRCSVCRIIYNTSYRSLSYSEDYFIKEYQLQYGKTYIDDYENIYRLSEKRLNIIFNIIPFNSELKLLDIGSAAGFFLKAAKDKGLRDLTGIEISSFAASYCSSNFGIPVIQSGFDRAEFEKRFDIITAWFFLEHSPEPLETLGKICSLLKNGGVLAMSLPSWFGPLFFFHRKKWAETHPSDHKVDFSPSSIKKLLKDNGFHQISVKKCGYHPDRVLGKDSLFSKIFEPVYRIFTDITAFSDTIEVYAVKK